MQVTILGSHKELFNNLMIDHVVFRTLIQSPGRIHALNVKTIVLLHSAITLQPKGKEEVDDCLCSLFPQGNEC